jgi:hypothetical protein
MQSVALFFIGRYLAGSSCQVIVMQQMSYECIFLSLEEHRQGFVIDNQLLDIPVWLK